MGNRKGQKNYPPRIKEIIREEYLQGVSQRELNRKYGVSRYTIQAWCGLRGEVNRRQISPSKKGRPTNKPEDFKDRFDFCKQHKIHLITPDSEYYPKSLLEIENYPLALFVRGDYRVLKSNKTIAQLISRILLISLTRIKKVKSLSLIFL